MYDLAIAEELAHELKLSIRSFNNQYLQFKTCGVKLLKFSRKIYKIWTVARFYGLTRRTLYEDVSQALEGAPLYLMAVP